MWSELRAPMVDNMRGIAPKRPEDVKNSFVDYPYIWNWLLTAVWNHHTNICLIIICRIFWWLGSTHSWWSQHFCAGRCSSDCILWFRYKITETDLVSHFTFQLINIVHTSGLVLPTIIINMLDSGISYYIDLQRVKIKHFKRIQISNIF